MTVDPQQLLDELRETHQVPGAALGILSLGSSESDDRIRAYASGSLNLDTQAPVQPDSIFQVGSITKTFTTTMIMQLVEQQKVDLDQPVINILRDLQLGDPEAAKIITLRHLLSHSSGIDGDVFTDHGRGDDAVTKYVEGLAGIGQLFRPGTMFSYCNAGFVLVGKLIEELTGTTWDAALHDQILRPLGLEHTGTLPEEAILGSAAVGHSGEPGEPRTVIRRWQLPRSIGPAGLINSTVTDVLTYARMHLRGGSLGGTTIITTASADAMRAEEIRPPVGHRVDGWQGLGWMVDRFGGSEAFGHNGATVGQLAYLQAYPDRGVALCLLTNGPGGNLFWGELRRALLAPRGIDAPVQLDLPPEEPHVITGTPGAVGRYGRFSESYEVAQHDGRLTINIVPTEDSPDPEDEPELLDLVPVSDDHFLARSDERLAWTTYSYGRFTAEQNPAGGDYLYTGTRLTPRIPAEDRPG
ncbi:serine hydrolase [Microlunatus sp. Gsoil 973]|uniref:serine hydrolase domain-containing protein n=1 Tax=Microlunatus sp. Gsoil 973 TaxID=2672569 RepID=UPI0012B4DEFE|nr:serine hydrolase domain-containing protein [Microlunatus sp. Gsoil 973]QGN34222.1 serine hydrolase [Microlunatus sp. Gsoil 973]